MTTAFYSHLPMLLTTDNVTYIPMTKMEFWQSNLVLAKNVWYLKIAFSRAASITFLAAKRDQNILIIYFSKASVAHLKLVPCYANSLSLCWCLTDSVFLQVYFGWSRNLRSISFYLFLYDNLLNKHPRNI